MKEKWLSCYVDFDTTVHNLCARDRRYKFIQYVPAGFSLYLAPPTRQTVQTKTISQHHQTTAERLIKLHTRDSNSSSSSRK